MALENEKGSTDPEELVLGHEYTSEEAQSIVDESEKVVDSPIIPVADMDYNIYKMQQAALSVPGHPTQQHITVRSFASDAEKNFLEKSKDAAWPHIRPNSVLICAMGFHWAPGSWEKVVDMLLFSIDNGVYVGLSELQDRCYDPYDALGTMRNEASLMAQNEGFEWILYIDNDVKPEKDFLINLLNCNMPIVAPYVVEPGTGKQLFGPPMSPGTGVHPAKWTVLSMLLFRTSVFTPFNGTFWSDAIGADEGFHFQKLWRYGHRPYIDTNTKLIVDGTPHYPLSSNRLHWEERAKLQDEINRKRQLPPNRKPISDGRPVDEYGQYMPWLGSVEKKSEDVEEEGKSETAWEV